MGAFFISGADYSAISRFKPASGQRRISKIGCANCSFCATIGL
jgi:hypothetical protein